MEQGACIILTSVETEEIGLTLANNLVKAGLSACVQLSAPGKSVYKWQGKLQCESECYLNIKTTESASESVIVWLKKHHPYETPEILRLNAESSREYLEWMRATIS